MRKKILALCCATMLAALSACSLPSATEMHAITTDQFWYGLAEQGYDIEANDHTAELAEAAGDILEDCAYYLEAPTAYELYIFHTNADASGFFSAQVENYEEMCNSRQSQSSGAVRMFKGSNKDDDFACLIYKVDNMILLGGSDMDGADRMAEVADYLVTTDFGDVGTQQPADADGSDSGRNQSGGFTKPTKDEPADTQEPVEEQPTEDPPITDGDSFSEKLEQIACGDKLEPAGEDGTEYTIDWGDGTELAIPAKAGWEVDDSYDYTLYVDDGDFSVSYSNSNCSTEDEVAEYLVEVYTCEPENCEKTSYDGKTVYVGTKTDSLGNTFYVFQDIGREDFLFIRINDYSGSPADEVIPQFLLP